MTFDRFFSNPNVAKAMTITMNTDYLADKLLTYDMTVWQLVRVTKSD